MSGFEAVSRGGRMAARDPDVVEVYELELRRGGAFREAPAAERWRARDGRGSSGPGSLAPPPGRAWAENLELGGRRGARRGPAVPAGSAAATHDAEGWEYATQPRRYFRSRGATPRNSNSPTRKNTLSSRILENLMGISLGYNDRAGAGAGRGASRRDPPATPPPANGHSISRRRRAPSAAGGAAGPPPARALLPPPPPPPPRAGRAPDRAETCTSRPSPSGCAGRSRSGDTLDASCCRALVRLVGARARRAADGSRAARGPRRARRDGAARARPRALDARAPRARREVGGYKLRPISPFLSSAVLSLARSPGAAPRGRGGRRRANTWRTRGRRQAPQGPPQGAPALRGRARRARGRFARAPSAAAAGPRRVRPRRRPPRASAAGFQTQAAPGGGRAATLAADGAARRRRRRRRVPTARRRQPRRRRRELGSPPPGPRGRG